MAEGWINAELGDRWEAHSAGTDPAPAVHPLAIRVMREAGVDLGAATPTRIDAVLDAPWNLVVTVCDSARETCPVFPRPVDQLHIAFPDPASARGTEAERLGVFREVRDAIRARLVSELDRRG